VDGPRERVLYDALQVPALGRDIPGTAVSCGPFPRSGGRRFIAIWRHDTNSVGLVASIPEQDIRPLLAAATDSPPRGDSSLGRAFPIAGPVRGQLEHSVADAMDAAWRSGASFRGAQLVLIRPVAMRTTSRYAPGATWLVTCTGTGRDLKSWDLTQWTFVIRDSALTGMELFGQGGRSDSAGVGKRMGGSRAAHRR
jgi:hypothetical protein